MSNFSNIPVDPDTRINKQSEIQINSIPALDQKWSWDGITANSLIFNSIDVEKFSDNELLEFIKDNSDIKFKTSITYSNKNGFRFINYNFEAT